MAKIKNYKRIIVKRSPVVLRSCLFPEDYTGSIQLNGYHREMSIPIRNEVDVVLWRMEVLFIERRESHISQLI